MVFVLKKAELERAIILNPYRKAESEPKTLHLYFLSSEAKNPDVERLKKLKANKEEFMLKEKVLYLHAPDGIGRSKLAAQVEKALGVPVTARNWRTVGTLLDMAKLYG